MNHERRLDQLRAEAREESYITASMDLLVPLPDGTEKPDMELTWEELSSLEPPKLQLRTLEWIGCYLAAENGLVYMGDGELKHIDELTPEDIPRLQKVQAANEEKFEAMTELGSFFLETTQDMEELRTEVDREKTVGDWLEN